MKFDKIINLNLFILIFSASIIIFLSHTIFTKTAIFADARFYYATTRSLVKDFNIKFTNEFLNLNVIPTPTHDGYVWNKYPPGVSLLWLPLFSMADGLSLLLNSIGIGVDIGGYGIIYQTSVAMTSIFLGVFGLYLIHLMLKDYYSEKTSFLAVFTLFATTNLLFYIAVEPINSHAASFFVSSFFIYYFLKRKTGKNFFLVLGILGGIAGLVRTQDSLILIIPLIKIFSDRKRGLKSYQNFIQLITGASISFVPQIIFWKKIYNTYWYSPYLEEGFDLLKPQIIHVLFNTQNGLFTITPFVAISLIGILFLEQKYNFLKAYTLAYFFLQLYLVSSWSSFFQGGSYSIRMIITTYPLLAIGLSQIISRLQNRLKSRSLLTATVIFFSLINSILIIRYLLLF